jgi:formylglycine-generating enzyme required for sulfatase activity
MKRIQLVVGLAVGAALVLVSNLDPGLIRAQTECPAGMVEVPAGAFAMGAPPRPGRPFDWPQVDVTLMRYCIDRTEVTVSAYGACVAAGACEPSPMTVVSIWSERDERFWARYCNAADRPEHPVNCVGWTSADTFCRWRGGRLPTEAEWEYAARGADGRLFPWGSEAPGPARLNASGGDRIVDRPTASYAGMMYEAEDGWASTAPVGSYPAGASPFGLLDMAGNVTEWTADGHHPHSPEGLANPHVPYPASSSARMIRGGNWLSSDPWRVAPTTRLFRSGDRWDHVTGFRCARVGEP